MPDRETIAVYVLLARVLVEREPYDARGALVLLHWMEEAFSQSASNAFNTALHLNTLAGLGDDDPARGDARWALTRVIAYLERLLAKPAQKDVL